MYKFRLMSERACPRFAVVPFVLADFGVPGEFQPVQRVQDAANDLTTATRFGRMDVAVERVNTRRGATSSFASTPAWGSHPHRGLRHPGLRFATKSTPTSR